MSMTFTKLFSSITESTIWSEPDHVRICWITMLAMADRKGRVWSSIPGLANRARISIEFCEEALGKFKSPDKYSRTPDNDGIRIKDIEGGWQLLNYEKYRAIHDDDSMLESKRKYINTRRAAEKVAEQVTGQKASRFTKPTLEQVKLSCAKIGLPEFEGEKFFNYYESKGWKVGKTPMVSWPHALANWKKNAGEWSSSNPVPPVLSTSSDDLLREAQG